MHCVYWLCRLGKRVLLVDADAQRSSSQWLEEMDNLIPITVVQPPDELLDPLPEMAVPVNFVVVDGPAGLIEAARELFRAGLAIVPCQPTGVDLRSASDAVRLIKQAQSVRSEPPKAAVFVSRKDKGDKA